MNSDGSGLREILYDEQGAKYGLTLSFDGAYSLFVSTHDYGDNSALTQNLFRMKNDGSEIVQVTHAPDFPCEGGLYCAPYSNRLSADGQKVVYNQLWKLNSQGGGTHTLVRRNIDGTNAVNLLDLPQADFGGDFLAINQDASVVVFSSQDDYTGQNPNHNSEFFAYIENVTPPPPPQQPNIEVTPLAQDFERIRVRQCSEPPKEFVLSNAGNADLNVSAVSLSDTENFALLLNGGANPCNVSNPTISPGSSCTVAITFCPSSKGNKFADLTFTSNDPNSSTLTIALSGTTLNHGWGWVVTIDGMNPLSTFFSPFVSTSTNYLYEKMSTEQRSAIEEAKGKILQFQWNNDVSYTGFYVDQLRDYLRYLNSTNRPVVILSHSWGTVISFITLTKYTDIHIDKLITLGSPLNSRTEKIDDPLRVAIRTWTKGNLEHGFDISSISKPSNLNVWHNYYTLCDVISGKMPPADSDHKHTKYYPYPFATDDSCHSSYFMNSKNWKQILKDVTD
jgi:hypothetical protein